METVRSAVQRVRESLFLVPAVVVGLTLLAARLAVYLDQDVAWFADAPLVLSVTPQGGRAVAAAVAGATITVAAVVFSITALSSQIASTQYSPRAVAGFFDDRSQKLVIGLVVGTFGYSVSVLAGLGDAEVGGTASQGSLAVTLALVLGIGSVVAILAYLDHSLRRLRIDAVVRRIAEATVEAVRRQQQRVAPRAEFEEHTQPNTAPSKVHAGETGWVRAVDAARLARSLPDDAVARIEVRVGEAVSDGELLATVWAAPDSDGDHVARRVRRAIHIGRDRNLAGDPSYGIRQLVDISLRALSPGINDPSTAIDVLQLLKLPMREILRGDPPGRVFDGPGRQRVFLVEAPTRSDYVRAAFSEIRLAATRQPSVLKALLEVLSELIDGLEAADLGQRASALRDEAALTVDEARRGGYPEADLARVLGAAQDLVPEAGDG